MKKTIGPAILLCLVLPMLVVGGVCGASESVGVSLRITLSPETARLIRQWRRSHGLPTPDEAEFNPDYAPLVPRLRLSRCAFPEMSCSIEPPNRRVWDPPAFADPRMYVSRLPR